MNMLNIMTPVLANLNLVKNSTGATLRKIGPNWVNGIGNWISTEGYLVTMNSQADLEMCGELVPFDTPIPLSGTKIVSYLHQSPMNALTAFNSVLPQLNIVKNSTGATLRKIGPNWVNGIGNLIPSEGYLVTVNSPATLTYPPADNQMNSVTAEPNKNSRSHFTWPGGNAGENTWTLYIDQALFNGVSLQAGDEVAIFDGDIVCGVWTLLAAPIPGTFAEFLVAFDVLGDLSNGYNPGNAITLKAYNYATMEESQEFTVDFFNPYGDAWTQSVFPPTNNEYSIVNMTFTTEQEECPVLVSAVPGDQTVLLEWTGIVPVKDSKVEKPNPNRSYFTWPGGNAGENTWTLYIDQALFNGVSLQAGDELAIFDGDIICGVWTFLAAPVPGTFAEFLVAFDVLGDLTNGYNPGNPITIKAYNYATMEESQEFEIEFFNPYGDAWTQGVFPPTNNEYSIVNLLFSTEQPYIPTFNIYQDGLLAYSSVEGNSYLVEGLTNGTEYCFTVTQNLEGGEESCHSNQLCATPFVPCLNAAIYNFPEFLDNACAGEEYAADFTIVTWENGT
ncbi:MAG: hypothetical protein EOM16_08835, partial [Bacteroidia bacterium]|nr:hypothetical protein [Bacteroidia bacterium]